jgi:hydroxymethylglutaryl-CoA synthase
MKPNSSTSQLTSKVALGCELSKQIGNTYTASVYMNLACLVSSLGEKLVGQNVVLFSYGSGALATMLDVVPCSSSDSRFSLAIMQKNLNVAERLKERVEKRPEDMTNALVSSNLLLKL